MNRARRYVSLGLVLLMLIIPGCGTKGDADDISQSNSSEDGSVVDTIKEGMEIQNEIKETVAEEIKEAIGQESNTQNSEDDNTSEEKDDEETSKSTDYQINEEIARMPMGLPIIQIDDLVFDFGRSGTKPPMTLSEFYEILESGKETYEYDMDLDAIYVESFDTDGTILKDGQPWINYRYTWTNLKPGSLCKDLEIFFIHPTKESMDYCTIPGLLKPDGTEWVYADFLPDEGHDLYICDIYKDFISDKLHVTEEYPDSRHYLISSDYPDYVLSAGYASGMPTIETTYKDEACIGVYLLVHYGASDISNDYVPYYEMIYFDGKTGEYLGTEIL